MVYKMVRFEDLPEIKAAQDIVNAYNYTKDTLPINVEKIMVDRNITIEEVDLPDNISGVLDTRGDKPIVLIHKNHGLTRKRFSLAHEFGHYILNSSSRSVYLDRKTFFRSHLSSSGIDTEEKRANRFAAELLMPTDILLEILLEGMSDLIDSEEKESLAELEIMADRFKVSVAALTIKISGVLKGMRF